MRIREWIGADTWADWRGLVGGLARICGRTGADSCTDRRGYVGRLVRICGQISADMGRIGADSWVD